MSEIITFYSYKGGVGRTMALANVSVVLSKWGHKVLVVDWDLEAPGLEHFYKDYIEDIKIVETKSGVIDLLQLDARNKWQDDIIEVKIPQSDVPIHLISSGKRDEDYFKKVRSFDVDYFYEKDGGDIVEQLRNEWLANYDYVLIDSRTGITEIGGICTIQLPDTVVMLFTATNQGFDGVLDIIGRASAAQQKLSYDRQKLVFLPIPSKFETNTEFKLSQDWLEIFAGRLENTYNDWLPTTINRKDFLELTKIPYIAYFSFGEKLPVLEQGVRDPSGLGYAYETLAALIANNLNNVDLLFNNREMYISEVNKNPSLETEPKKNGNGNNERKLRMIKQSLNINEEVVKLEMNKEVIINCLQNSIFPLIKTVSNQLKNIESLFKEKKESLEIKHRNKVSTMSSPFSQMSELIRNYDYADFSTPLIFSYTLINLRKYNKQIIVNVKLSFHFFQLIYEIRSESINIDKLYHEIVSSDETESIAQAMRDILLEKIGDVMIE